MLSKLAEKHNDWIDIVKSYGVGYDAEDIVQDMYIEIHKYSSEDLVIKKDGSVNVPYVFQALKHLIYKRHKKREKRRESEYPYKKIFESPKNKASRQQDCLNGYERSVSREEKELAFNDFTQTVKEALKNHHWYYERLYHHYTDVSNPSIRTLAKEIGVGYWVIDNDLKVVKKIIKELEVEYKKAVKK